MHLGKHRWLIVDSFMTAQVTTRRIAGREHNVTSEMPAASAYLDSIYSNSTEKPTVDAIVITHFHRDHYEGVLPLHNTHRTARLVVTAAVKHEKFRAVFGSQAQGPLRAVGEALENANRRRFGSSNLISGLRTVAVGSDVIAPRDGAHVVAIAPTDAACNVAARELAAVITPGVDSADVGSKLEDDNRTSIALHVTTCGHQALLGGDVVEHPHTYGWAAVVGNPDLEHLGAASIVKVPHHGGSGAHHDPMWRRFVEPGSPLLVAPYWRSSVPSQAQQSMLRTRGELYQAATSSAWVTSEWDTSPQQEPFMGVVQARRGATGGWVVGYDAPAHKVQPAT